MERNLKILGIDDNEDINNVMKDVFESAGHDFTSVNNGRDGVKLIREHHFDAVLLDIAMPKFNGKDVINVLVKEGIIKKQPVIVFTASLFSDSEVEEVIKKGVHSCIRKPIGMNNILDVLKNLNT